MLPPHDLFLPVMAASATFMALVTLFILRETFIGVLVMGTVRRWFTRLWDTVARPFRSPRTRLMMMCWRSYSRIIDVTTNRAVCTAFHRDRARHSWFSVSREAHGRLADSISRDSLDGVELRYVERFVSLPVSVLRWISRYLGRRLAGAGIGEREILSFLLEEQANASRDGQSFLGHVRRFRERFGVSMLRRLDGLDAPEDGAE